MVCITSDRGLCGAYNSTMMRMAERQLAAIEAEGHQYALYVGGKKALTYFRFRNYRIDEAFLGVTDQPTYEQARAIGEALIPRFVTGELLSADIAYWRYISAGTQEPVAAAHPAGRDGPRRPLRPPGPPPTSSTSRRPRASSASSCRATSPAGSSRPCSTPRPPSTRPSSGP